MTNLSFDTETTALLVIDPYNDFISEGGKLWDRIKGVAEANDCISHMLQLLTAARKTGVRVLRDASSIPSRRLRDLEVRRTDSESSPVAKDVPNPSRRIRAGVALRWLVNHSYSASARIMLKIVRISRTVPGRMRSSEPVAVFFITTFAKSHMQGVCFCSNSQ
jgi:hypothetical protein